MPRVARGLPLKVGWANSSPGSQSVRRWTAILILIPLILPVARAQDGPQVGGNSRAAAGQHPLGYDKFKGSLILPLWVGERFSLLLSDEWIRFNFREGPAVDGQVLPDHWGLFFWRNRTTGSAGSSCCTNGATCRSPLSRE